MEKRERRYDLISIGEPLLRLSPPEGVQIRRTSSFDVFVAGSQLNIAANLARLGASTAFLTKLPSDPLGMLIIDSCRSCGVDTSLIKSITGKMGLTYVEFSAAPRPAKAIYDRAGSTASTITPDDFDFNSILSNTRYAYTDGIFPGLSPSCRETAQVFLDTAKKQGCVTCFDVNYREHLWTESTAKETFSELLPKVDLLATNRDVSERVFGYSGSDEEIAKHYVDDFSCRVVSLTSRESFGLSRGAWNSRAFMDGKLIEGGRIEFDIIDRYGTGDAWLSGFLWSWMNDSNNLQSALAAGNSLCALAHTIRGDVAHITTEEIKASLDGKADLRVRR